MPRRQKQRQNRRSGKNSRSFAMGQNPLIQSVGSPEKVVIKGKALITIPLITMGSPQGVWPIHPLNFGGHLTDIADAYDQYRFRKVRIIFTSSSSITYAICFQPLTSYQTVLTQAECVEQVASSIAFAGDTIPCVLDVPRSLLLATPTKWFPTNTSITSVPVIQGGIVATVPSGGFTPLLTVFEYECEFCMPCDPSARMRRPPLERKALPDTPMVPAVVDPVPDIKSNDEFPPITDSRSLPAKPTNWLGVFTSK
jgi:hypothetical protein